MKKDWAEQESYLATYTPSQLPITSGLETNLLIRKVKDILGKNITLLLCSQSNALV